MVLLPNVTSWKKGSNKFSLHQNFNHFIFPAYMQPRAQSWQFEQLLKSSKNYVFHRYIWSFPIEWYMYVHSVEFAMWKNNGSLNISYAPNSLFAYLEWACRHWARNLISFNINRTKKESFREIIPVRRVFSFKCPENILNKQSFSFFEWNSLILYQNGLFAANKLKRRLYLIVRHVDLKEIYRVVQLFIC